MARGWCVERGEGVPQEALEGPYPLFLKPARTHASIGIDRHSVVCDERALRARLAYLEERFEGPFLIEEFLPGREINVAVFPEPEGGIYALTEIDFSSYPSDLPKIVTYNCKWVPGTPDYSAASRPAEDRLTVEESREVRRVAREALLAPPPRSMSMSNWLSGTRSEPLNIRCSNRCAKPVRPGDSSFEPTANQVLIVTIGCEWSSCRITVSPLGSV